MTIEYNALAAWAAVFASLVAALALWSESRRSRFSLGIDLILKLEERFDSDQLHKARRTAAESLKTKNYAGADDVLDFFETLGMLTNRKALNEHMVWSSFFYWLQSYWCAASEYILQTQKKDKTVWKYFTDLHKRMLAIEQQERGCSESDMEPSEESLKEFLEYESNL